MIFHSISDSYNKGEGIKKEENLMKFLLCRLKGNLPNLIDNLAQLLDIGKSHDQDTPHEISP